jgi:hypothetical protein
MAHTEYVRTGWEPADGRTLKAEFQINDSEAYPGRLAIHVAGYETGDDKGTAHVRPEHVVQLRDALTAWIDNRPATD